MIAFFIFFLKLFKNNLGQKYM